MLGAEVPLTAGEVPLLTGAGVFADIEEDMADSMWTRYGLDTDSLWIRCGLNADSIEDEQIQDMGEEKDGLCREPDGVGDTAQEQPVENVYIYTCPM